MLFLLALIFTFLFPTTVYFNIKNEINYKKNSFNIISSIFFTNLTKTINDELEKSTGIIVPNPSDTILNALKEVGSLGGYSIIRNRELFNYTYNNNKIILKTLFLPSIIKDTMRKLNINTDYIVTSLNKNIILSNIRFEFNLHNKHLISNNIIRIKDRYFYIRFNNSTYSTYPIYVLFDMNIDLFNYIFKSALQWSIIIFIIFGITYIINKNHYLKIQKNIEDFSKEVETFGIQILKGKNLNYSLTKTNIKEIDNIGIMIDKVFKNNIDYINKNKKLTQDIINLLGNISEFRDEITGNHIIRVGKVAKILAKSIFKNDTIIENYYYAAQMHDIGKIGIPDSILLKSGKLNDKEFEIMKKHAKIGYNILKKIDDDFFDLAAKIALYHHEKFNGMGYPKGLKGEDIPIEGRIIAICDVFDALISERPYKKAFSFEDALKIIKTGSGTHFDPKIVSIFLKNIEEIRIIYTKEK
ncbi:putative two-component system response regulator [Marinitoga hydrogenitolerans DSM 16785]|uniref:Two-component system response regulator n=2 Tax=Marinitoga TaxID=160798 RepID=A0A1M4ZPK4_MARH1|nr:putative two-component system response regulator [Marinitoga hydrogenitolerans DSM 16785]